MEVGASFLSFFLFLFTNVRVRLSLSWLLCVTFSSLHCHCHYIGSVAAFMDDGIGGRLALAFVVRKVLGRSEDGWTKAGTVAGFSGFEA